MPKIRIKKKPQAGDQKEFALMTNNDPRVMSGDSTNRNSQVKKTMGENKENPEDNNVEVEKGESMIGDINQDGLLEHFHFTGKKHSEGGIDVEAPPGAFIFSNTRKLKIKDKEIQSDLFGMSFKKEGYTPAQIAKKYQINEYIATLKDQDSDEISKRTANEMLKNNIQKLGMLSLVQESMKGFPKGIPAIAQSVLAGLQGGDNEQMEQSGEGEPMMRNGGQLPKAQWGTGIMSGLAAGIPLFGYLGTESPNSKLQKKIDSYKKLNTPHRTAEEVFKSKDFKDYLDGWRIIHGGMGSLEKYLPYIVDDFVNNDVKNPALAKESYNKYIKQGKTGKKELDPFKSKPESEYYENPELVNPLFNNEILNFYDMSGELQDAFYNQNWAIDPSLKTQSDYNDLFLDNNGIPFESPYSNLQHSFDRLQNKNNQQKTYPTFVTSNQTVAKNNNTSQPAVTQNKGTGRSGNYSTSGGYTKYPNQGNGQNLQSQYDEDIAQWIKTNDSNAKWSTQQFKPYGTQPLIKNSGLFVHSNDPNAIAKSDLSQAEWADFYERHGKLIDKEYQGTSGNGFEGFKNDIRKSRDTGTKAAEWFQGKINEMSMKKYGKKYFLDPKVDDVKGVKKFTPLDKAFGIDTYSVPGFYDNIVENKEGAAGKGDNSRSAYYCVSYANGTKNVVTVSYKDGEQPVPPAGSNGSAYADLATANASCIAGDGQEGLEQAPIKKGGWYLQDLNNFAGTLTDQINRYEPMLGMVDQQSPGYVLKDPTRLLAASQEQMARYNNQLQNTVAGNMGAATMLGASGEGFNNAANAIAGVEGDNVGIVNNVLANKANIENQESVMNANALQKYVGEVAMLNQNIDEDKNFRKWRQIGAFNQGTENYFKKKQMEQVLFPQVFQDPISGDWGFSGKGRDMTLPDTYSPSYGSNNRKTGIDTDALIQNYIDNGSTPEQAIQRARLRMDAMKNTGEPNSQRFSGVITPWDLD